MARLLPEFDLGDETAMRNFYEQCGISKSTIEAPLKEAQASCKTRLGDRSDRKIYKLPIAASGELLSPLSTRSR
jgi:hypothetical protein